MHLLTGILIIPWITLVTKGHDLECYDCTPEMGKTGEPLDCKQSEATATCEHRKCAALTAREAKKMELKILHKKKYCINADQPCGSVNMGENFSREDCCSTDKCNIEFPKTPDELPANGLKCCTGKDNNCTNVLQCTGNDDHCISGTVTIGTVVLTGKGCASENMCVDQPEATCCKGNRCNGERIDPTGDTSGLGTPAVALIVIVIAIVIVIVGCLCRSILDHLFNNDNEKKFPPEYILPHTYKDMQPVMTKGVSRDQDSGSEEDTGDQGVQRELIIQRSMLLCFLLALISTTTFMALYCEYQLKDHSVNNLTALTLEINLLKADYTNLMLERNQLQHELKKEKDLLCESVKSCPRGWQQFGCSCYHRSTTWKTWEESRQQCLETPGADLVVIDSKEEQEFIKGLNDESSSWIGLKRTEGKWTWLDRTPLTTQYWDRGYPDENQGDWNCARYWHSNGKWSSGVCSDTVKSICEICFS